MSGASTSTSGSTGVTFVYFLGIRTEGSLALRAFPKWMTRFASNCTIKPVDMRKSSSPEDYLTFVRSVRDDPQCVGAQITSHKMDIFGAAWRHIDHRSQDVENLEEIGGLVSGAGELSAISPDAMALGTELSLVVGRQSRALIVLGGGGAGRSIALSAAKIPQVPSITITELNEDRLSGLDEWKRRLSLEDRCSEVTIRPGADNEDVVSSASTGTVVVNATGLGKDAPGSPISEGTRLPEDGVVWDLNYRGELKFLEHARRQAEQGLVLRDGFSFFLRNWTCFLEAALDRKLSDSEWPAFQHDTQEERAAASLSTEVR